MQRYLSVARRLAHFVTNTSFPAQPRNGTMSGSMISLQPSASSVAPRRESIDYLW